MNSRTVWDSPEARTKSSGEVLLVSGTPYAGRGLRPLAVARDSLLQNPPHPLDIIPRMPPIAQRVSSP
jgi:hypothetical protein